MYMQSICFQLGCGDTVTGILVPVILVLGTNFFVENFGPPGPVFSKIMVRSRNFGPPYASHSIVMIYTKGFYLHAIKFKYVAYASQFQSAEKGCIDKGTLVHDCCHHGILLVQPYLKCPKTGPSLTSPPPRRRPHNHHHHDGQTNFQCVRNKL